MGNIQLNGMTLPKVCCGQHGLLVVGGVGIVMPKKCTIGSQMVFNGGLADERM
jgi:hypothetical protein